MPRSNEPKEIKKISDFQSQANIITILIPSNSSMKLRVKKYNYTSVAVSKQVKKLKQS